MEPSACTPEDRQLHAQLLDGDTAAAALLYRRHLDRVRQTCLAVLFDDDLAEDTAQEVFMEYLARPGRADLERLSLRGYLSMMARRRAIDVVRSRESARRREARVVALADARRDRSDREIERVSDSVDIWRAVAELPIPQRRVVHQAFVVQRTYSETAVELGIAEGTAKSRMRSALTRLRSTSVLTEAA